MSQMKDVYNSGLPLLRTPVEVVVPTRRLSMGQRHVFMGSCFAEHVGGRFERAELTACVNPLGVLYNPASIARILRRALDGGPTLSDADFIFHDGLYHCWLTDSHFSAPTLEECREHVVKALTRLHDELLLADNLFITLGTNHCYLLASVAEDTYVEEAVVGNCHRVPQREFREYEMEVEDVVKTMSDVLDLVYQINPQLQVVMTVSPYRYRKYGFHGSQVGKATLLLAIEKLRRRYGSALCYFPAYEILLDELRDYRYYASDMIHPSADAVDYIFHRLAAVWMDVDLQQYVAQAEKRYRQQQHRPIANSSD